MLCWWSILTILCLDLLVSAVDFHGVSDVSVGNSVSLGLEMDKKENFDPFDLLLQSTESDGAQTMLQHITNVSLIFTVSISIPQLPNGFYIYCAAEPDSGNTFSRSNRFLITNNVTDRNNDSSPQPIVSSVTPIIPNPTSAVSQTPPVSLNPSSSLPSSTPRTNAQNEIEAIKAQNTRLLIIISAVSAILALGLVAALVIYLWRRSHQKWLEAMSPIQYEPFESVVRLGVPRLPEPKFSAALSDSLGQIRSGHLSGTIPRSMSATAHARMSSLQVAGRETRTEDPPPGYV